MVTTMDMEGMRNGIGEIIGQTLIIIGITQDIWDMMIGIDGGMEMEGKKVFIQRNYCDEWPTPWEGRILRMMEKRMDQRWNENRR